MKMRLLFIIVVSLSIWNPFAAVYAEKETWGATDVTAGQYDIKGKLKVTSIRASNILESVKNDVYCKVQMGSKAFQTPLRARGNLVWQPQGLEFDVPGPFDPLIVSTYENKDMWLDFKFGEARFDNFYTMKPGETSGGSDSLNYQELKWSGNVMHVMRGSLSISVSYEAVEPEWKSAPLKKGYDRLELLIEGGHHLMGEYGLPEFHPEIGLPDPYVEITLGNQKCSTPSRSGTTTPTWNTMCFFDITPEEAGELTFRVKDSNIHLDYDMGDGTWSLERVHPSQSFFTTEVKLKFEEEPWWIAKLAGFGNAIHVDPGLVRFRVRRLRDYNTNHVD